MTKKELFNSAIERAILLRDNGECDGIQEVLDILIELRDGGTRLVYKRQGISLTKIDKVVWITIEEFINSYGYSPSIKDIMRIGNISSTSVVKYSMKKLEKIRVLRTIPRMARATKLLILFEDRNVVKEYSHEHN